MTAPDQALRLHVLAAGYLAAGMSEDLALAAAEKMAARIEGMLPPAESKPEAAEGARWECLHCGAEPSLQGKFSDQREPSCQHCYITWQDGMADGLWPRLSFAEWAKREAEGNGELAITCGICRAPMRDHPRAECALFAPIRQLAAILKANEVERQDPAYVIDCASAEIELLRHDLEAEAARREELEKAWEARHFVRPAPPPSVAIMNHADFRATDPEFIQLRAQLDAWQRDIATVGKVIAERAGIKNYLPLDESVGAILDQRDELRREVARHEALAETKDGSTCVPSWEENAVQAAKKAKP